jgi:hypothetical protein
MKFKPIEPPRIFEVGRADIVKLKDCARIELEPDEQVTFLTESGAEYDVVRKSWGFYATPSLNGRLRKFGLRAVLVKSPGAMFYIFLVENGKEAYCQHYLEKEGHQIICWLDRDRELEALERKLKAAPDGD